jgi:ketosteroid isomerase-like protein
MSANNLADIEKANEAFYRALESNSMERMEAIWVQEEWVNCIHPGWDRLTGWKAVREGWEMIFESNQRVRAHASDVSVYRVGDFALVTCTESITVFNEDSFDSVEAVATNVFVERAGQWLMAHHHASPIPMIVADSYSDTIQ